MCTKMNWSIEQSKCHNGATFPTLCTVTDHVKTSLFTDHAKNAYYYPIDAPVDFSLFVHIRQLDPKCRPTPRRLTLQSDSSNMSPPGASFAPCRARWPSPNIRWRPPERRKRHQTSATFTRNYGGQSIMCHRAGEFSHRWDTGASRMAGLTG